MRKACHNISIAVLAAGFALGTASLSLAQTTPDPHHPADQAPAAKGNPAPSGMMGRGMMGGGMMELMQNCPMMGGASHTEGRIAFLRAELGITDAHKAVWEAYATQLKANLQGMAGMQRSMTAMMSAKSPGERLDASITMMEGRLKALKDVKPALAALYAALTPEQKAKADQLLTGMGCMM